MKRVPGLVLACGVALGVTAAAQSDTLRRDGNWQVAMEMDIPGAPQGMPPTTFTQCVTKADVADPAKAVPQQQVGGAIAPDCKVTDYRTVGNKVIWSMECGGQNPMRGQAEFVYTADTFTGTMTMNMERGGQPFAMKMKYNAKRLGDCTK